MDSAQSGTATAFAVEATSICYSYDGQRALNGLSLSVQAGALFGLLGPNGSGKSTLLALLAGLRQPDSGTVLVFGDPPAPALRARIGFLFQESSLDPLMTARESLVLHGRLFGLGGAGLRAAVEDALQAVGLADRARSFVHTLSGGMKRRLELARALLPRPELLLLDEPTTGLDPDSEQALWAHLMEINRTGVTIILSTNKVFEADRYCDTVAFIHAGALAVAGSPSELKSGLKRDAVWAEGAFQEELLGEIRGWEGVGRLTWAPPVLHVTVDSARAFVPRLFQAAGDRISGIRLREASLEDAYFDAVGSALDRDGQAA